MAIVSVDLPAHNVYPERIGGFYPSERVGGTDCLAVHGDGQYMRIDSDSSGFYVGAVESGVLPGTADDSGDALGFGLFDLPAGATLIDCRFVTLGFETSGATGSVTPGDIPGTEIQPIPLDYPIMVLSYFGDGLTAGYGLTASSIVGSPITHLIDGDDYVIAGIGTPDTGTFGLCPKVELYPYFYASGDSQIIIDYLAIRVTYEIATTAPARRLVPRTDSVGPALGRFYPPSNTPQASGRFGPSSPV